MCEDCKVEGGIVKVVYPTEAGGWVTVHLCLRCAWAFTIGIKVFMPLVLELQVDKLEQEVSP